MGGLLAGEPRHHGFGGSDHAGGVDRCGLSADNSSSNSRRSARPLRVSPATCRGCRGVTGASIACWRRRVLFWRPRGRPAWSSCVDGRGVDGRACLGGRRCVGGVGCRSARGRRRRPWWCRGRGRARRRLGRRGRDRGRVVRRSRRSEGRRCSRCGWVAGSGIGRCSRGRRRARRCRGDGRGPRCRLGRRRRYAPTHGTRSATLGPAPCTKPAGSRTAGRGRVGTGHPWSSTAVMVPTVPLMSGEWRSPWRVWSRTRSPSGSGGRLSSPDR